MASPKIHKNASCIKADGSYFHSRCSLVQNVLFFITVTRKDIKNTRAINMKGALLAKYRLNETKSVLLNRDDKKNSIVEMGNAAESNTNADVMPSVLSSLPDFLGFPAVIGKRNAETRSLLQRGCIFKTLVIFYAHSMILCLKPSKGLQRQINIKKKCKNRCYDKYIMQYEISSRIKLCEGKYAIQLEMRQF